VSAEGEARDAQAGARGAPRGAPQSPAQALEQARLHGRAAAAESLLALHALLDAAALAASGAPAPENRWLAPAAQLLADLAARLEEGKQARGLLAAIAEALDVEIARWEQRARQDADARAVLRAFLGLRELLWEFGVRPGAAGAGPSGSGPRPRPARPRPPRVQRVPVEG
jgi:hypothetical protein